MAMKHFIAGNWFSGSGEPFESVNPANGDSLWQGRAANASEVNLAVEAARNAFPSWASTPLEERIALLNKFKEALEQDSSTLVESICLETAKPLWESQTEVSAMIKKVEISIQAFQERSKDSEHEEFGAQAYVRYKPLGVMAVIGPFNFPGHLPNGHIVPALLAGNTIVFKPSEFTPLVTERMIHCWRQAGLPSGVLNMVHGGKQTGEDLLNTSLNGVLFTGSYATGKHIHQHFAGRPDVLLALEMGGNNPLILGEVSDVTGAAYFTVLSAYITAGQRCSCARRIMVPNNAMGDAFIEQLTHTVRSIHVGEYAQTPQPFMGALIDKSHAMHYLDKQQALIDLGGNPLVLMESLRENSGFVSPGLIDMSGVKNPPDEELFAPFLQVNRYDEFEQALTLANNTQYGLSAGLFSDDEEQQQVFYQQINAGVVNINRPITGASSKAPFGGTGRSGNHRPSAFFATDYCVYPVAGLNQASTSMPAQILPGLNLELNLNPDNQ